MITKETITEAYVFLRKNNNSIPDETLDFMKEVSLKALEQPKVNRFQQRLEEMKARQANHSKTTTTNNWIKVSERLPEIDGEYLVTLTNKTITNLQFSQFVVDKWFHVYSEVWTNEINPVTHWQPLPNTPKD